MARHARERDRQAQPLPGRRRGAQLRGQRRAAAARDLRRHLDPARGRRRRRRARRGPRLASWCRTTGASAPVSARAGDAHAGRVPRPGASRDAGDRRLPRSPAAIPYRRARAEASGRREVARRIAAEQVVGLRPGADGVRPARARQPLDRRRRPLAADAVGAEPEDQVPRVLPALRAGGARGARRRLSSTSTARRPTCCWWRR